MLELRLQSLLYFVAVPLRHLNVYLIIVNTDDSVYTRSQPSAQQWSFAFSNEKKYQRDCLCIAAIHLFHVLMLSLCWGYR